MKDQHTLIDDYVKGLLNDEDKANFEIELAKDETLQQEVNFRKAIVHSFKFQQIKQTIEQAKLENEQEAEKETKIKNITATIEQAKSENTASRQKRIRLYRTLSIAAVFFAIIAGGIFSNTFQKESLLTNIIVSESKWQPVTTINIEKIESLVNKANQAIDETDFVEALSIMDQLRNEEGFESDEMLQNECYIYFKQQNYAKANRQADRVKDVQLQNKVRWQLSDLYLDASEIDLAKQQLKKIQLDPYKKKAIKKLKKIN